MGRDKRMSRSCRQISLSAMLLCCAAFVGRAQTGDPAGQTLSPLDETQAQPPAPPRNALDKEDLEFYLRHLNVWAPHINVEISDFQPTRVEGLLETTVKASYQQISKQMTFYVSEDGQHVFRGDLFDIEKNPFQSNLLTITTEGQPSFGTEGAPVVIVAYSDFQCPYCAKEAKILRNNVAQTYPEQVRVYFRDYPLSNHDWAMEAAIAGQCIYGIQPEAFWAYHDWIFENQRSITPQNLNDKVAEFAARQGIDALKLSPCIENRETEAAIRESIEEGRALGITSTPTIFVNGRKLSGSVRWQQLKAIIDYEIEYQKITQNAGDDCGCEVDFGAVADRQ